MARESKIQDHIAVFGMGVVGGAFVNTLKRREYAGPILIHDPKKGYEIRPEELAPVKIAFVCVPTPTGVDGRQDLSVVQDVFRFLCEAKCVGFAGVVCIRSTVTPLNVRMLERGYPLAFTTLPEFLTERDAYEESFASPFLIVGSCGKYAEVLAPFINTVWPDSKVFWVTPAGAMMIKYAINVNLAVRVSTMNELKAYWDTHGDEPWDRVVPPGIRLDCKRLGDSHFDVPGPDGKRGFGGKCLPKDVQAIAVDSFLEGVLCGALRVNAFVREEDDAKR